MVSLTWQQDFSDQITPWLGRWEGHSLTKRSGVYGATIKEADTVSLLEMDDKGHLVQVRSNINILQLEAPDCIPHQIKIRLHLLDKREAMIDLSFTFIFLIIHLQRFNTLFLCLFDS